jgi:hypothetical protein
MPSPRAPASIWIVAALGVATSGVGCVSLKPDGLAAQDAGTTAQVDAGLDVAAGLDAQPGDGSASDDAGADAISTGALWPADVPVCWALTADQTAPDAATVSEQGWIHDDVESNWSREANLRFGAWPPCPTQGAGLFAKVAIDPNTDADAGGRVDGTGTSAGTSPAETAKIVFWPFVPLAVGPDPRELTLCAVDRLFSRVLGLSDDPAAQPVGTAFCGDEADPLERLSPLQILRVRRAYGPKPPGSIVAFDGRCLTVPLAEDGSPTQTAACLAQASGVAGANQRWSFDPWGHSIRLTESGLALDAIPGSAQQGAVRMPVAASPDQVWSTDVDEIRGIGGTCLNFQPTLDDAGGPQAVLWRCERATTSERFDFGPGGSIRATAFAATTNAGAMCLAASAGSSVVAAAPCDGGSLQQWNLAPGGAIQCAGAGEQCLEAIVDPQNPLNRVEDGIALRVNACSGAPEQQFDVSGTIQSFGSVPAQPTLLDVASFDRFDGATVQVWGGDPSTRMVPGHLNEWWDIMW